MTRSEANAQMAERGLRVLAVAVAPAGAEQGATLLGLIGIADPPRTEAIEAVAAARAAGITTVMITGDHPRDGPRDRAGARHRVEAATSRTTSSMREPRRRTRSGSCASGRRAAPSWR